MTRLAEAGSRLWQARSLREGLEEVLAVSIELIGADMGNVQVIDAAGKILHIVAQRGFRQDFLEFFREVSYEDDSACGRALRASKTIVIEDIERDVSYEPFRPIARAAGYRAVISVPIIGRSGTSLGMISAHFRSPHRPSDADLAQLDLYKHLAAGFIERSRSEEASRVAAAAAAAAEHASLAKSRLLAMLSHDLRQPLQTLAMLLFMLRRAATNSTPTVDWLSRAQEAVESMSGLMNGLLDLSQLEAGSIQPQLVDFAIDELLSRIGEEYRMHAKAKGLQWRYVHSQLYVRSDPLLLEQMVRNLLSNAIRYTDKGRILLGCRRRGNGLRIEVHDTGTGIAEQDLSRIFEEHQRVGEGATRGGHGLGLAIVQRLGKLLGHKIGVHSQLARGSTFTIELPLAPEPSVRPGETVSPELPAGNSTNSKILVVDDDPALRQALEWLLTTEGYRVFSLASGAEASTLISAGTVRPDLIISDYCLQGGVNGVETIMAIRLALATEVPAIVLTGVARHSDLAPPGSIVLSKPVKSEELLWAIRDRLVAA